MLTRSQALFTSDPVIVTVRLVPFYTCALIAACIFGLVSVRLRTIRWPLMVGYLLFTAGVGAMMSVRPGDSTNALIFCGLAGLGLGAPLSLVFSAVQLAVPHHVLATATAFVASARAIGISVFTAIFTVALNQSLASSIAKWVPKAAAEAGVPTQSISAFVLGITTHDPDVGNIPGVTASMVQAGALALQNATSDALRVVFAIATPFGLVSVIIAYFLGSFRDTMNYVVEAPLEELHAKHQNEKVAEG